MCGICGIINFKNETVQEAPVRKMMQIMKHRGPDDEGIFLEENVGLGFVRLSIIDLSPAGHQPMSSHDERYVIVYNGEIYNYIELRNDLKSLGHSFKTNSDTEVLLASYIEWGEDCLHRFNGMWAFVIYDRIQKRIFAARDRYGIKPFYYCMTNDFLAFASEIPPLLSLLKTKPKPDYQSIFDYLVFNRTDQTERTFFEEIKKLQHGHSIEFKVQGSRFKVQSSIKRWYNLKERVSQSVGFKDPEEYRQLLSSSIGLRLRSDVPVGVCLSGGLDSSSIVSILLKDYNKSDLNTFSAVYETGQAGDETEFIKEFSPFLKNMFYTTPSAEMLDVDLLNFVRAQAEPIPETGVYAQFRIMKLASEQVTVTLDGQGADEELAGYHYFFGFFFKDLLKQLRLRKLSSEMMYYLVRHKSIYGLKTFIYFLLSERSKTRLRVDEKGYLDPDFVRRFSGTNSIAGDLYNSGSLNDALINHFEYKLEHLLKWEDRNSMWFSLEARVPFLDYRLVEKSLATSGEMIIRKGWTKHILRESMRWTLPEKIRARKDKIGFGTPQADWFRTKGWDRKIVDIVLSNSFRERRLIDPDKALKIYKEHLFHKRDASKEIWKWVNLELWFHSFID
ncbi:MAG: asparagine synthase (glutamine-hydrolyzing) [Bacteroidales bacterium]|jgi:asparagine synthase (glutamine-hydrolysing)|nr:asparagine synthase (glutamine-hydrolyzing) [Bacteroidales bacterium]